jgi:molybdopterin-containing oxidoreductase family iron-sulfur binding subunit
MSVNRRKFLEMTGAVAALGLSTKGLELVAKNTAQENGNSSSKRLAMVIDMSKFINNPQLIQKCINACVKEHNIPKVEKETHQIKWIWDEPYTHAFIEQENEKLPKAIQDMPVLLLCNHCDNPPCTDVCPTQATWRRESDGVVMMDWHRCIGCRYCMAACPYGSRSFNWFDPRPDIDNMHADYPTRKKGVVEKCTFCDERLARGQIPACVEVAEGAMIFGNLNDPLSPVRRVLANRFSLRRKPELGTHPEIYYIL